MMMVMKPMAQEAERTMQQPQEMFSTCVPPVAEPPLPPPLTRQSTYTLYNEDASCEIGASDRSVSVPAVLDSVDNGSHVLPQEPSQSNLQVGCAPVGTSAIVQQGQQQGFHQNAAPSMNTGCLAQFSQCAQDVWNLSCYQGLWMPLYDPACYGWMPSSNDNLKSSFKERRPSGGRSPSDGSCPDKNECAKLRNDLECDDNATRDAALDRMKGKILGMSFHPDGCRIVQLAFKVGNSRKVSQLVEELHRNVPALIESLHGNYVIQKAITCLNPKQWNFIVVELAGNAVATAKTKTGCRVVRDICNHCNTTVDEILALVDEILAGAHELIKHEHGHYVIQSILENGTPEQRHRVAIALSVNPLQFMKNKGASFVLQTALEQCAEEDQTALIQTLLTCFERNEKLATNPQCVHVLGAALKTALTIQAWQRTVATRRLQRLATVLSQSQLLQHWMNKEDNRDEVLLTAIATFTVQ